MNKHKITCDICMDLMPLVKDGIASEDSRIAVEEHMMRCPGCKANFYRDIIPEANWEKSFNTFVKKMHYGFILILMFGIAFGLGLTASEEMFYNSVLMPIIGVLGYIVFHWHAAYLVPLLMSAVNCLTWLLSTLRGENELLFIDSLSFTLIYCIFVLIGVVIAGLVHWCISKGNTKQKVFKIMGLIAACFMIAGIGLFANALVGNPISRLLAGNTAKKYLARQYNGTDYEIDEVNFNFKDTDYYAKIKSPSSTDTYFMLNIDMGGHLKYDSYESQVTSKNNTAIRLNNEYRTLTDTILESNDFPFQSENNICFGDLIIGSVELDSKIDSEHILKANDLELDGIYDVGQLGSRFGELTLHIDDENVTATRAAEILLEIKALFDERGIGVYCVDFMLSKPRPKEGPRENIVVWIKDFLWEDISEDGLAERIQTAHDELQKTLDK